LEGPRGLTFDSAGNLFISELSQYVRRVDAVTHIITTVAGNGQIGDAGDGGPATQAELYYPAGLAVDSAENLYIVEQGGDVVRKVDLNLSSPTYGIITLYAGTEGAVGFGGDGGPATMAIMQHPQGLAIDKNDNLFIADTENQRIRVVDKATQTISTAFGSSIIFSGDGGPAITAGIGNPGFGLAFDLDGNLLIDDEANNLVRVVKGPDVFKAQCSAVGKVVLADPTGDATDTLTSHDIQSIGVGEPYLDGCGSNALSFTMKVANLAFQSDEPGGRWTIYFTVSNGSEYFVDMEGNCTSSPIGVCFNYGHTATPAGGTKVRTIDGQADSRSNFTADGLITIVVPNADFTANSPAPATADTLTNINATVEVSTAGPLVDSTVSGTYTLSGSSSCKPNYRPMAGGLNVTPPSGTAPLAVNFTSTCSREPDACDVLASYTMDFGDGTAPTTQSSPNFSHTYTSAGNYIANLSVTDSAGTVSSNASRVAIQVTSGNPVQLTNVVSRKLHGGAGTFDIGLPLSGPLGIECRSGGSSSSYTLVFTFANPLSSVAAAGISSGAGSVASSNIAPDDAHNYIVNLTGVTNAQVITVTLSNVSDSAGNFSPAMAAQMGVLLGDVNASRRVDAADVSSVRQQTLQPLTSSNFRMDLNASGRIDAADVSIARQQTLTSLP
jgi:PKD repeat protein